MQRSKQTKGRPATAALFLFLFVLPLHAAGPKPYHLELEAYPASPFPSLSKFGTVSVHVYPAGVRADSFWLSGFTRKGSTEVTVMNPLMRMYTDVPITQITSIVAEGAGEPAEDGPPAITGPTVGKVGSLRASRYRLMYGPTAWIDVWTTTVVPDNPQFRAVVDSLVRGLSPATAKAVRSVPGTPLYIELNFRRFHNVVFMRLKRLTWNNSGEAAAMKVGSYYLRAPLLDAIWH
jgi:hypothetical protein